jgi:hypothetical protein
MAVLSPRIASCRRTPTWRMSRRQAAHVKESSAYRHRRTEIEFNDRTNDHDRRSAGRRYDGMDG